MRIGTVPQLWRYPVKSMGGERRVTAGLTQRGIPGDRGWAVYDKTRGGVTNAKRLPLLRDCQARYRSEPIAGAGLPPAGITLPDGTSLSSDSADAARQWACITQFTEGNEGNKGVSDTRMSCQMLGLIHSPQR